MNCREEYRRWLESPTLSGEEKEELLTIKNDDEAIALRFSAPMDFGTAGLRSTMYMGIGNMNRYTVAQTTRGIAALIKAAGGESRGAVIAYDSRNHSKDFARVSACVLAGAGIKTYIFDDIRPTPELSFAVRKLGTLAGINITASHNPKEYNGYKAYWEDGAQISPEQAKVVSNERALFDVLDVSGIVEYDDGIKSGLIVELNEDFDEMYLDAVMQTAVNANAVRKVADDLKVVYTPLHGAGYKLVPEAFRRAGLKYLYTVDAQMIPDGNFPTVAKPNPEYPNVFKLGIGIANTVGSDLVIATDPDSDRVGVMARTENGDFKTITGNQMGALLLDYVIKAHRERGTLTSNAYCVKSIVSTDMAYKIAEVNGIKLHDVLTGFKYIGEVIKNYEQNGVTDGFVLGFEESYGYLLGTYARDKDAVEASMLILEMTAYYKNKGMTLSDALDELYKTYGLYAETMIDVYMEGLDGIEKRKRIMSGMREIPPKSFGNVAITSIGDYKDGKITNLVTGNVLATNQPSSDVLYYVLENEDKIIVRPSGTEPKIKIYILAHDINSEKLNKKLDLYANDARKMTEI